MTCRWLRDICGVVDQFFLVHCPANTTWIIFFCPKTGGGPIWTSFGPVLDQLQWVMFSAEYQRKVPVGPMDQFFFIKLN